MIGFVLKCITAAWSLQTRIEVHIVIILVFDVFQECYGTLPHPERPCPLHMRQKFEKRFWRRRKRNPTKLCLASAPWHQHRSPAAALEETTNQRQRQNRNGSWVMLSGKPATIWDFRVFIWKSRVGSFARAIGGCIMTCEKDWHWLRVAWHLHNAKHFAGYSHLPTNFIYFQRAGLIFHQTLFQSTTSTWQRPFQKIPRLNDQNYSIVHQLWPPIQPNLDQFIPDSELCVDCCTVGKVNQDWRLPLKPAQCCPWRSQWVAKNHLGKSQSEMWGKKMTSWWLAD